MAEGPHRTDAVANLRLTVQFPRFTQQRLNLPSLGDSVSGEQAGVLVCF